MFFRDRMFNFSRKNRLKNNGNLSGGLFSKSPAAAIVSTSALRPAQSWEYHHLEEENESDFDENKGKFLCRIHIGMKTSLRPLFQVISLESSILIIVCKSKLTMRQDEDNRSWSNIDNKQQIGRLITDWRHEQFIRNAIPTTNDWNENK